ncbi:hypothetical protein [Nocardioides caricicola]|uniref:Lipoprotein n=1 Tax=Nocardioides caricicola TaxID=634770 RepID=A0ABW0N1D1_9ACTN
MTRIGLAVASVGLATALTACGGGDSFTDQSAEEIADASKDAMADLKSVKVAGSITADGQQVEIDIQTDDQGSCVGSIGVDGASAELLGADGKTWFRPSEEFWRQSGGEAADQLISMVGDKWVVIPEGEEDGFGQFCDLDELLEQMLKDDEEDDDAKFSKGDTQDIDGEEAIAIDQEDPEDGTSTGYVLVDEPHYLVKIEKTDGEDSGDVTFSAFDEEVDAEAPAEEDTIDLDSLGG